LTDLKVISVTHNSFLIDDIFSINNVTVVWNWKVSGLSKTVTARMTFVVNTKTTQIVELHSSQLPTPPAALNEN